MNDKNFYIIWNPDNPNPPTHKHYMEADARTEAERLARQNPGQRFYVLKNVAACKKIEVIWDDEIYCELPF